MLVTHNKIQNTKAQEVGRINIRDIINQKNTVCWNNYFVGWKYEDCSNCIATYVWIHGSASKLEMPGNSSSDNHWPVKSLCHSSKMPVKREYFILLHYSYRNAMLVKLIPLESLRFIYT